MIKNYGIRGLRSKAGLMTLLLAIGVAGQGCEFLDPTEVENPRTTEDDLANATNPTAALLPGVRAQFARMLSAVVSTTENVSDNYSIHGTGIPSTMDSPRDITPSLTNSTGTGGTGAYWNIQEMRALADFVLEISQNDATATADDIAEAHYYRGLALLVLGENFSYAPIVEDGTPLDSNGLITEAIAELQQATSGAFATRANASLARAYRMLGNSSQAVASAAAALGGDPDFLFQREYDSATLNNTPYAFLVSRALQEMQPLPRLDFLDPKYLTRDAGIAYAKAEEMHLIMAEAALAGGDVSGAATSLANAIRTAQGRGFTDYTDNDQRLNADLSIRPRTSNIEVRADDQSPYVSGLVLDRPDVSIPVPTVTSTSLDPDVIEAETDEATLWHALFLSRQEMMVLEGRRMSDLGIRLPIMLREIDSNPNINDGDPGTSVVVPAYIPPGDEMDLYDPASPYDADGNVLTTQITIRVDMNKVLAANRVTPF